MSGRNWDRARRDDLAQKAREYDRENRDSSGVIDTSAVLDLDECWCGRTLNHDWPGKADGAAHPRVVR